MTAFKCAKCGFVSARDQESCKRCGTFATQGSSPQKEPSGARRFVIPMVLIALAVVLVIAGAGIVFVRHGSEKPSPGQVAALLSAEDSVKLPINLSLVTEFSETQTHDGMKEEYAIRNYAEGRVFKDLGLATTTFTVTKAETKKCFRYDNELRQGPLRYDPLAGPEDRTVKRFNPNGEFEQCDDAWNYHTVFQFDDPENIDRTWLADRIRYVTDINDDPPPSVRATVGAGPGGEGPHAVAFPIGVIEIVEVSDVVEGSKAGTYTVGFKFRFKPNALGELYDVTSSVHNSLPLKVRWLFAGVPKSDQRFQYLTSIQLEKLKRKDSDGLVFGHAELTRDGLSGRWKTAAVYFDQMDDAKLKYTYHQVE
jgi:hypothetical protein